MTATCTFAPTAAGTAAPSAESSADVSDETLVRETFSAEPDRRTAPATTRVCGAGVGEAEAIGVDENERDEVGDADSGVGDAAAPDAAGAAEDVEAVAVADAVAVFETPERVDVEEAVEVWEAVAVADAELVADADAVDDAVGELLVVLLEDEVAVDEAVGELEVVPVAVADTVDELVDDAVADANADTLGSADVVGSGRQPPEFAGVAPSTHSQAPSPEPFTSAVVAPTKYGAQL